MNCRRRPEGRGRFPAAVQQPARRGQTHHENIIQTERSQKETTKKQTSKQEPPARNRRKKRAAGTPQTAGMTLHAGEELGTADWSSRKEHRADAWALRAEERRDKLRKAVGRSKYPESHGYLNGATRQRRPLPLHAESIGMQGEPGELKHLSTRRKRKKHRFPK